MVLPEANERLQRDATSIGQDRIRCGFLSKIQSFNQRPWKYKESIERGINPNRRKGWPISRCAPYFDINQSPMRFVHSASQFCIPPIWIAASWPIQMTKEIRSGCTERDLATASLKESATK
jgi:hypothetical protein